MRRTQNTPLLLFKAILQSVPVVALLALAAPPPKAQTQLPDDRAIAKALVQSVTKDGRRSAAIWRGDRVPVLVVNAVQEQATVDAVFYPLLTSGLETFARLTDIAFHVDVTPPPQQDPRLLFVVGTPETIIYLLSEAQKRVPATQPFVDLMKAHAQGNLPLCSGLSVPLPTRNTEIYLAISVVQLLEDRGSQNACLNHAMLRAMGFDGDLPRSFPSTMAARSMDLKGDGATMTNLDRILLRTLYDPEMPPNADPDIDLLAKIVARHRAAAALE